MAQEFPGNALLKFFFLQRRQNTTDFLTATFAVIIEDR